MTDLPVKWRSSNEISARTRRKEGTQKRTLADGGQFTIYKKYFDQSDLLSMRDTYDIDLTVEHFGKVFLAATVTMKEDSKMIDAYQ